MTDSLFFNGGPLTSYAQANYGPSNGGYTPSYNTTLTTIGSGYAGNNSALTASPELVGVFALAMLYQNQTQNGATPQPGTSLFNDLLGSYVEAAQELHGTPGADVSTNTFGSLSYSPLISSYTNTAQNFLRNSLDEAPTRNSSALSGLGYNALTSSYSNTAQNYLLNSLNNSTTGQTDNFTGFGFNSLLDSYTATANIYHNNPRS